MTPREIIAEAWTITRRERKIRLWGFFSSFFETLFLAKLLIYQAWFVVSYLRGNPIGFFDDVIWLYDHVSGNTFFTVLVVFFVLLAIELVFPSFARGAIVGLSAKAVRKEELKGSMALAIYNFFPMFGIHEFFILGNIANVVTFSSLAVRYVDGDVKIFIIAVLAFFWLISVIFRFMASFAEPAVVVNRMGIFAAMGMSFKLIISYTGHVMFLWLLLFVISIRVAINTVFALLIPGIVIGLGIMLTHVFSSIQTVMLISVSVGILLILVASYFFAYLHVFRDAVWTITYLELKKFKDLTVIEE